MAFVLNTWYPAAWSSELGQSFQTIVLCEQPVLLYRNSEGQAVALRDQCPHRKLPLSLGRLCGDELECGYHGMRFNAEGRCTRIPGQSKIVPKAKVRAYPTTENLGLVWVWLGDPEKADPKRCFDLPAFHDANRCVTYGVHRKVACHYQLLTDNLTDPAHVAFVHRSTLGSAAQEDIPVQVTEQDDTVVVSRWTLDSPPAPIFKALGDMPEHVDRWQYYTLQCPSICVVDFGSCEVGAIGPGDTRDGDNAVQMYSCIFMAPEDAANTHYFYLQVRNFGVEDAALSETILQQFEIAFNEDFAILEAQQAWMDKFAVEDDVQLAIDAAPKRQRRIVSRLLAEEGAS